MLNQKNAKPFKTLNQQLELLRARGLLDVHANAQQILEQIGYYSLINGYKGLFLARDANGRVISPERFQTGTSFNEIVALYEFDFELRSILYRALLKYETRLRTAIATQFTQRHPEAHAYLALDNFSRNPKQISSVVGTISSLSGTIKKYADQRGENAIKHYVNRYGYVPLWVLVNFLTFGELKHFYANCTNDIQQRIAKDFKRIKQNSYHDQKQAAISPTAILEINRMVNLFRNAVAHGEITYAKVMIKSPHLGDLKAAANLQSVPLHSQAGLFELVVAMKAILTKPPYQRLSEDLLTLIDHSQLNFSTAHFQALLRKMHFPPAFAEIMELKKAPDRF